MLFAWSQAGEPDLESDSDDDAAALAAAVALEREQKRRAEQEQQCLVMANERICVPEALFSRLTWVRPWRHALLTPVGACTTSPAPDEFGSRS